MSFWCVPQANLHWRAVPTVSFAAPALPQTWWQRAWQWFFCAVQLVLGRLGVIMYVPVRVSRVPRSLQAVHTDPRYRPSYRFLSSLRSPPRTPHC